MLDGEENGYREILTSEEQEEGFLTTSRKKEEDKGEGTGADATTPKSFPVAKMINNKERIL